MNTEKDNQQSMFPDMTWEQFYEKYKPEELWYMYSGIRLISDIFEKDNPGISIGDLTREFGKFKHKKYGECIPGILYLFEWLIYFNKFSNINKPLSEENIEWLSKHIYAKYHYFCLSDLKLIFEWLLEGKYGKFYGSVDAQLILTAFKEYKEEIIVVEQKLRKKK